MSLESVVSATTAPGVEIHSDAVANEAKLRLQHTLVFLDGKKLKPLRALEQAAFDGFVAKLLWPGGPSMRLCFPDEQSLNTFRGAVEGAQARAAKTSQEPTHTQAVQLSRDNVAAMTPPAHMGRKRPLLDDDSAAKRRASGPLGARGGQAARVSGRDVKVQELEEDIAPAPPRVDQNLTDEERARRRSLAAAATAERLSREQLRGIGDASAAKRMQERAERETLVGRIKERYDLMRKEIPWNLVGATIAELRAYLNSPVPTSGG